MPEATLSPARAARGGLTRRQADVVRAIHEHTKTHGRPPSLDELAWRVGVARAAVGVHCRHLVKAGWLEMDRGCSRTMRLLGVRMVPQVQDTDEGRRLAALLEGTPCTT